MIRIPLTQGQFTVVDDEDFALISQYKWYAQRQHTGKFYAIHQTHGPHATRHAVFMHRLILKLAPEDKTQVDHRDRDTLNNRRENLRKATGSQNVANGGGRALDASGYRGITKSPIALSWQAHAMRDGISYNLGNFGSAEEAARAYDTKARELFGEFACLNFPDESGTPPKRSTHSDGAYRMWQRRKGG